MSTTTPNDGFADHSTTFDDAPVGSTFIFVSAEQFGEFVKVNKTTYKYAHSNEQFYITTKTRWNRRGASNRLVRVKQPKPVYHYHTLVLKVSYHGDDPADFIILCDRVPTEEHFIGKVWANLSASVMLTRDDEHIVRVEVVYSAPSADDNKYLMDSLTRLVQKESDRFPHTVHTSSAVVPDIYLNGVRNRQKVTMDELREYVNAPTIEQE